MAAAKKRQISVKLYDTYYYGAKEQDPVVGYLRAAKDRRGFRRKDVKDISPTTADNIWSGKTRSPRFSTVMVLARCIGPEGVEAVASCLRNGGKKK